MCGFFAASVRYEGRGPVYAVATDGVYEKTQGRYVANTKKAGLRSTGWYGTCCARNALPSTVVPGLSTLLRLEAAADSAKRVRLEVVDTTGCRGEYRWLKESSSPFRLDGRDGDGRDGRRRVTME